ncbi:MAG: haloalkane dehalogenase [Proteobacteria bacterium]|nr:haloalkane dehalogenase [Pseudomonadota bacterium]
MNTDALNRRWFLAGAGGAGLAVAASPVTGKPATSPTQSERAWREIKRYVTVHGEKMTYVEMGSGRPIVFLHGNPTSSYLWRNIMPHVEHLGRCIAPDLIGMGDSAKLPNPGPGVYNYATHRKFLFGLLNTLKVDRDVVFVIHDWGSGLGFDFASHNPSAVRGIAYSEAIVRVPNSPPPQPPAAAGPTLFDRFQTSEGEHLVLDDNIFVEQLLIGGLKYYLTEADEAEYRRPYLQPGADRWPTLQWPRELPAYNPTNAKMADEYSAWLAHSAATPKLFLHALPGAILANPELLKFVRTFPNQKEVTLYGSHYVQEISPDAYGRALAEWIPSLG